MAGYILREDQPNIVLPAQQADRLIGRGDGDAALLYLCLLRADRGVTAQELQRRLKWSQLRLHAAETALQELGLIDRPPEQKPPEPAQERPVYTADDLTDLLTGDAGFRMLVPQTEEKLGKRLKTADLQILAGLYDDLGLPADVIYLLVCHCVARSEERYGPRPQLIPRASTLSPSNRATVDSTFPPVKSFPFSSNITVANTGRRSPVSGLNPASLAASTAAFSS